VFTRDAAPLLYDQAGRATTLEPELRSAA
jgi:hypothetical protein